MLAHADDWQIPIIWLTFLALPVMTADGDEYRAVGDDLVL